MEIFNTIVLSISGFLLLMVGVSRLSNPIKTYAKSSGITLNNDVNLLNEARGVSAVQLCSGVLILLGIFIPLLTFSSFLVASLVFLGFAIGRILSMSIDGKPNSKIVQGLVFELVLGGLSLYCLMSLF